MIYISKVSLLFCFTSLGFLEVIFTSLFITAIRMGEGFFEVCRNSIKKGKKGDIFFMEMVLGVYNVICSVNFPIAFLNQTKKKSPEVYKTNGYGKRCATSPFCSVFRPFFFFQKFLSVCPYSEIEIPRESKTVKKGNLCVIRLEV